MPKKVLIVGAGGFIGGFIAAESLRRGYETWCGVRESTSRRYLTDPALRFITLDYDNPERLAEQLKGYRWDYIVYNLGATKCVNFMDFNRINYCYLRDFVDTLTDVGALPERMVYMSSLSAIGPGDEKNYTPLNGDSIPCPNTRYGLSKIKAETYLQSLPKEFPWIILRPTGVYGPHEQDYLMMIKSIDSHFDFGVGMRKQMLTFIYVEDLARAIFDALEKAPLHRKYIISEPRAERIQAHSIQSPRQEAGHPGPPASMGSVGGLQDKREMGCSQDESRHPQHRQVQDHVATQLVMRCQPCDNRFRI